MTLSKKGKVVATIEARIGSTRLPGKTMKKIIGKPMLALVIERVKKAKRLDEIVVATSVRSRDDVIENLADKMNVKCFRGSEDDVLDRVLKAAQKYKADHIVELWGDAPLLDPQIIDTAVDYYLKNKFDCLRTCKGRESYADAMDLIIFPTKVLEEVSLVTSDPMDREHVSTYIYEHPKKYKIGYLPCPPKLRRAEFRLVVDEPADFKFNEIIFKNLYPKNRFFSFLDIIKFLDTNPEYKKINKEVKPKTRKRQKS